jgi:hypothetical protein
MLMLILPRPIYIYMPICICRVPAAVYAVSVHPGAWDNWSSQLRGSGEEEREEKDELVHTGGKNQSGDELKEENEAFPLVSSHHRMQSVETPKRGWQSQWSRWSLVTVGSPPTDRRSRLRVFSPLSLARPFSCGESGLGDLESDKKEKKKRKKKYFTHTHTIGSPPMSRPCYQTMRH